MTSFVDDLNPCYFHGVEEWTLDTWRVCFECHHHFTERELLDAHNGILAELRGRATRDGPTADPGWAGFDPPDAVDAAEVRVCPLCTHDF